MAEIRNCVTTVTNPDQTITEVCVPCSSAEMHDNCKCEGCDPITVSCSSIECAICVPILADKLYDSTLITREEMGSLANLVFTVDNINPDYAEGQLVCIQQIGLSYDFIGLPTAVAGNRDIVVNGQTTTLTPASLYNAAVVPPPYNLFNELYGTVTLQPPPCCCGPQTHPGTKLRTSERNRDFQIASLGIVASGIIGNNPFTAKAIVPTDPGINANITSLTTLGISDMTFSGKICWPLDRNSMNLYIQYNTNLAIDCIIPTSNYRATGSFTANADFSFAVARRLYASSKGAIAVFTTPNATLLKNGAVIGNCL